MSEFSVTVAIDTEEDNWGSFAETGATSANILELLELQDLLGTHGARPTYLVNRPPLMSATSVQVLGRLAAHPGVEIGAHCHPWNTPPSTGEGAHRSMMCNLPSEANRAKIAGITKLIGSELGVRPTSFRAGRWGFGATVATGLAAEGYSVDVSVSPFIDWTGDGGPDYSSAPNRPYRFDPERPLEPTRDGSMVEIPTTVGYLSGGHRRRAAVRRALQQSIARRFGVLGVLNRAGVLARRWLSPETTNARDLIRLAAACFETGEPVLGLTFHSCALLPGATPFVRDQHDRKRFMDAIGGLLRFCAASGGTFHTIEEVGRAVMSVPIASHPSFA